MGHGSSAITTRKLHVQAVVSVDKVMADLASVIGLTMVWFGTTRSKGCWLLQRSVLLDLHQNFGVTCFLLSVLMAVISHMTLKYYLDVCMQLLIKFWPLVAN